MAEDQDVTPFKLAMRHEGDWWVAYIDEPGDGRMPVEVSRIRMKLVQENVALKDKFIEVNQLAIELAMSALGFSVAGWGTPYVAAKD